MPDGHHECVPDFADEKARLKFRDSLIADLTEHVKANNQLRFTKAFTALKAFMLRAGSGSGQGNLFASRHPTPARPPTVASPIEFDPSKHPRGAGGKFAHSAGRGTPERLARAKELVAKRKKAIANPQPRPIPSVDQLYKLAKQAVERRGLVSSGDNYTSEGGSRYLVAGPKADHGGMEESRVKVRVSNHGSGARSQRDQIELTNTLHSRKELANRLKQVRKRAEISAKYPNALAGQVANSEIRGIKPTTIAMLNANQSKHGPMRKGLKKSAETRLARARELLAARSASQSKPITYKPHEHASSADEPHVQVHVNIGKVESAIARNPSNHVGPNGAGGIEGRYEQAKKFVQQAREAGTAVRSPRASLDKMGDIQIEDGRHRFAALRDSGETHVEMSVPKSEAATITAKYGDGPSLREQKVLHPRKKP